MSEQLEALAAARDCESAVKVVMAIIESMKQDEWLYMGEHKPRFISAKESVLDAMGPLIEVANMIKRAKRV